MLSVLSVRIPQDISARLDVLAEKTGRKKTFHVASAITEYMDDLEDGYLALSVLERIKAGDEKTLTAQEFWHGVEN